MDLEKVSEEFQELMKIKEMLISKVFTVISIYQLRGGQNEYRGNVINFSQDIEEFITRLPWVPSSLEVLIVRRQSSNNLEGFRDFTVRHSKVGQALSWLKANNRYYSDVVIDNEVLQTLPENDSIVDQLRQIRNQSSEDSNDNEIEEERITQTFVPLNPPSSREKVAINNAFDRIQTENLPVLWPEIDGNPINEFQTAGYIVMAFLTLYPTGDADLRAEQVKEVKPAEYFKHMLRYKDERFGRHTRWRYFALNSQMRWQVLLEGKVYVKQKLNDLTLRISDIQERIAEGDTHMADRIMKYGENIRGS